MWRIGAVLLSLSGCVVDTHDLGPVSGLGMAGKVPTLSRDSVAFGVVATGCGDIRRALTLDNRGARTVSLVSIVATGPDADAFRIAGPAVPATVAPGASVEITVDLVAQAEGRYSAELDITVETPTGPLAWRLPLDATRSSAVDARDRFVQSANGRADILFVIDDSCSMADEQAKLVDQFRAFIAVADSGLLDYRLAVTTTGVGPESPDGRFLPLLEGTDRVVDRGSLPSPYDHFGRLARVGIEGKALERGLDAVLEALSPERLEAHNIGFLREEAVLSLVIVSDEEDQSARPLDAYVEALLALKGGDPARVRASAIVGMPPDGCREAGGSAAAAWRYVGLTEALGGYAASICGASWASTLAEISAASFGLQVRFRLSGPAVPGSVRVSLDGRPPEAGRWQYDPAIQSVVFEADRPPLPGSRVDVDYRIGCE